MTSLADELMQILLFALLFVLIPLIAYLLDRNYSNVAPLVAPLQTKNP
jgi:hypothetical protein